MYATLRRWLTRSKRATPPMTVSAISDDITTDQMLRIQISKATNGHVVQVQSYKHNPHGPDWTGELYVVPSGESLLEAIKAGLVARALS